MVSSHKRQASVIGAFTGWAVALTGHILPRAIAGWEREYGTDSAVVAFELGLGTAWTWLLSLLVLARSPSTPGSVGCAAGGAAIGVPTFALLFGPVSGEWPSVLDLANGAVVGSAGGLVYAILQHRAESPTPLKAQPEGLLASIVAIIGSLAATRILEGENGLVRVGILVAVVLILRTVARSFLARLRSPKTKRTV